MRSLASSFRSRMVLRIAGAGLAAWLVLPGLAAVAADPAEFAFNAVDGVPHDLVIAVGNKGTIVHFPAGGAPTKMPSGTDRDLLDIHVAAPDFAIAVGRGIVLLWDGKAWRPIVVQEDAVAYTESWAGGDRRLLLYGEGAEGGGLVCPWLPGAARQPFCRRFAAPLRAACGKEGHYILLLGNGEFHRLNNALINPDGAFEPAFRPRESIGLRSAWLADGGCEPEGRLPVAFAVDGRGRLVHFDGERWWLADRS